MRAFDQLTVMARETTVSLAMTEPGAMRQRLPLALIGLRNERQALLLYESAGPAGFLESRTPIFPRIRPTSMHSPLLRL